MSEPKPGTRPWWLSLNAFGVLLLAGAFAFSMYRIYNVHQVLFNPDETILRVSHWQLEAGYREALQEVIDRYEKMWAARGKKVRVLQMPVTERVYSQWLNTNLISGQAPDIALMGMSAMVNNEQYLARYFVPLTSLISRPNPYNKGTDLENVPWRETFFDGMRGLYNTRLQDYYSVPTATYNIRIFYNKDMFKAAMGSDAPPATFGELLKICGKIQELANREKRPIIPIAGSQYSVFMFTDKYAVAFTAGLEPEVDLDLDGYISQQEIYIGFARGKLSMQTPRIRAFFEAMQRVCEEFGKGFAGKDRQTAAFEFAQQRAAMIATGSWDAQSLFKQAEEAGFEVGIFDFPMPAKGEPWGEFIAGKPQEATSGSSGSFGLYKFGHNFDQVLDFLQFLSSREMNQLHMSKANWIPVVLGTEPTGRMQVFAPNPIGFSGVVRPYYGGDVETRYRGAFQSYLQGEKTYDEFASIVDEVLRNPQYGGDRAWTLEWDDQVKQLRNQERVYASHVARELLLGTADAPEKERQVLLQQLHTTGGEGSRYLFREWRGFDLPEK